MSNSSAIGSVTAALFHLLSKAGVSVTTLPPDEVSAGSTDQLNLYLYGTEVHAAFRNEPMRGTVPPGQPGVPPLALVLRYLLTSYGDNEDFSVHEAMGKGMLVFHDHPILNKSQIDGLVPDGQLTGQVEKIKITPIPMSLDDMSKLWTSFQTEYRLSAAYEVSVVLIESEKAAGAPLPVLRRGEEDQGASVLPSPAPQITGFRFPHSKPAANLGDTVTLLGEHLSGQGLAIRFEHPELEDPIELEPHEQVSAGELTFRIPAPADEADVGSKWPAGFYSVSLLLRAPDMPVIESGAVPMALAPTMVSRSPATAPAGAVVLTIECLPRIRTGQRLRLLFADQEIAADSVTTPADATQPSELQFTVANAQARTEPYLLRLRVSGVDSVPIDVTGDVLTFDSDQMVTIT